VGRSQLQREYTVEEVRTIFSDIQEVLDFLRGHL
jgi:hypothetical protein